MSLISLDNICFNYGEKAILKNISVDIGPGWTTILGPNGAGKSTLLNILNGLRNPEEGVVKVLDQDVHELKAIERARVMSTIHQKNVFSFPVSCFEMVSHGRYAKRKNMNRLTKDDYNVIHKAMHETNTLEFSDKSITQLSGGEQQRIMLASSLAQEPKIMFIDEGFSALDINHKREMVTCLKKKIKEEDLIVVSVIHDMNMVYQISDQVILLKDGQVIKTGKTKQVMTKETIESLYDTKVDFHEDYGFRLSMEEI